MEGLDDQGEREQVLTLVRGDAAALGRACEQYRSDPDVVLAAVARYPEALQHAGRRLLESRRFMVEVAHCSHEALDYAPERWRTDGEVLRAAARRSATAPGLEVMALHSGSPAYEGETLRLVAACNEWSTTMSSCRFRRVLRGRDCSGADPGAASPRTSEAPPEAAEGAVRHRLVVHLESGYLRFHVVSCLWVYALAVVPTILGQTDAEVLVRGQPLPAGECNLFGLGRCESAAHFGQSGLVEKGFTIREKAGVVVSIFVELFLGGDAVVAPAQEEGGAAGTGRRAAVWYVPEQDRSLWKQLVSLRGEPRIDEVIFKPWARKVAPCCPASPVSGTNDKEAARTPEGLPARRPPLAVELLEDILGDEPSEGLLKQVFELSRQTFAVGFGALQGREDVAPPFQLTLAADASRTGVLGYLLYELGQAHLKIQQMAVMDTSRRRGCGAALVRWAEQRALAAGCVHLEARALKLSLPFYTRMGFVVKRGGVLDPDGVDVELVLGARQYSSR
uniref:N-acetyltransferase domain-containing protein n=1 Tax=Alexandrium monilatum TaxID=311494 RepID=A0A7S4SWJ9_9DINO